MGYTRMSSNAGSRQTRAVRELTRHSSFDMRNAGYCDVALVRLETAVELNRYVSPVCLTSAHPDDLVDNTCYVAGWGKTHASGGW